MDGLIDVAVETQPLSEGNSLQGLDDNEFYDAPEEFEVSWIMDIWTSILDVREQDSRISTKMSYSS